MINIDPTIMSVAVRKGLEKIIIDFILCNFNESRFDRMMRFRGEDDPKFMSYDHFIIHNERCVENLSQSDLHFIISLIGRLGPPSNIVQYNEDNFSESESCTIFFNIDDKLVIMSPRWTG
jgi:hypothetical protein